MSNKFDISGAMFNKPHFSASDDESGGNPPDPAVPTRIKVTLDNLEPYAGNPRTQRNPNYDEIKESIRYRGLDHAPNVTRPTPDQPYIINDGGNTRLQILQELWEETGDRKFFEIDCMFRPWKSERDVLVAHIIENEMRGRMSFIDRARAAVRLKQDLEREQDRALSINELAQQISGLGWSMKQPNLSAMVYAYDNLLPFIPETLDAGMGRPTILAIKRMLDDCRKYWDSVAQDDEGTFDTIWQPIFEEMDSYQAFDISIARDKIEEGIASRLDCPVSAIRAEIQGVAEGYIDAGHRPVDPFKPGGAPNDQPIILHAEHHATPNLSLNDGETRAPTHDLGLSATPPTPQYDAEPEAALFEEDHHAAARSTPGFVDSESYFDDTQEHAPSPVTDTRELRDQEPSPEPTPSPKPRTPKTYSLDEAQDIAYQAAKRLAGLCQLDRTILSPTESQAQTPEPFVVMGGSLQEVDLEFRQAALDVFGLIFETLATVAIHIRCQSASTSDATLDLYKQYLGSEHLDWHLIKLTVNIHKTHPDSLSGMTLRGKGTAFWAETLAAIDHFYWAVGLFLHTYSLENQIDHYERSTLGSHEQQN